MTFVCIALVTNVFPGVSAGEPMCDNLFEQVSITFRAIRLGSDDRAHHVRPCVEDILRTIYLFLLLDAHNSV